VMGLGLAGLKVQGWGYKIAAMSMHHAALDIADWFIAVTCSKRSDGEEVDSMVAEEPEMASYVYSPEFIAQRSSLQSSLPIPVPISISGACHLTFPPPARQIHSAPRSCWTLERTSWCTEPEPGCRGKGETCQKSLGSKRR
jgi:hypothetical protein